MDTLPSLLIIACGNPSRGDDALGPALAEALRAAGLPAHVEIIEDFQLQVEHALDLLGRDQVLFVDAGVAAPPPFMVERLEPAREAAYTTHVMPPQAVLHTYVQLYHRAPPPSFLLTIRGEAFALGQPLSAPARANLAEAINWALTICRQPFLLDL